MSPIGYPWMLPDIFLTAISLAEQSINQRVNPDSIPSAVAFEQHEASTHGAVKDFDIVNTDKGNNTGVKININDEMLNASLYIYLDKTGANPEDIFIFVEASNDDGSTWIRKVRGIKGIVRDAGGESALVEGRFRVYKNEIYRICLLASSTDMVIIADITSVTGINFPSAFLKLHKEAS